MHAGRFANVTIVWLAATNKRPPIYAYKPKKIRFRRGESNNLVEKNREAQDPYLEHKLSTKGGTYEWMYLQLLQ